LHKTILTLKKIIDFVSLFVLKTATMSKETVQVPEQKEISKLLKIGVDIDGTILKIDTWIFRIIKRYLGVDLRKVPVSYHLEKLPEIVAIPNGPAFVRKMFECTFIYEKAIPIAGALETLEKWKTFGHQIWFVTARPKNLKEVTEKWFADHNLAWATENIIFMDDFSVDRAKYKNEIAGRLGFDVLIDDHPETLRIASSSTLIAKIGLRCPANQNEDVGENSVLVESWKEIDKIVGKIK
jgi:hypothetical protein